MLQSVAVELEQRAVRTRCPIHRNMACAKSVKQGSGAVSETGKYVHINCTRPAGRNNPKFRRKCALNFRA